MGIPSQQPFVKEKASQHGSLTPRNLLRRQKDYAIMIGQAKIGDGHRDANGYHEPGSNKK